MVQYKHTILFEGDFTRVDRGARDLASRLQRGSSMGGTFKAGALAAAASLGLVASAAKEGVSAAIDFESALADVRKVLPQNTEVGYLSKLSEALKETSVNVGVIPDELARGAAALAQSGIAARELALVTEDAAKLAVAFDMTSEEAGQALAKMRTGLKLSREEVNLLADRTNVLSNNYAATAKQITDTIARVGSLGPVANVAASDIAALSTVMIASGAKSNQAATGVKNFLLALATGASATKRQSRAFAALGLDSTQVAKDLAAGGRGAQETIQRVIGQLAKLEQHEKLAVLKDLVGRESLGAIGSLASNTKALVDAFDLVRDDGKVAGSVLTEFQNRSQTTAYSLARLKSALIVLGIQFGDYLLPYVKRFADFLSSKEGREWGSAAVARLTGFLAGLFDIGGKVVGFFSDMSEKLGQLPTLALTAGAAILALSGPWGIVAAAAVAAFSVIFGLFSDLNQEATRTIEDLKLLGEENDPSIPLEKRREMAARKRSKDVFAASDEADERNNARLGFSTGYAGYAPSAPSQSTPALDLSKPLAALDLGEDDDGAGDPPGLGDTGRKSRGRGRGKTLTLALGPSARMLGRAGQIPTAMPVLSPQGLRIAAPGRGFSHGGPGAGGPPVKVDVRLTFNVSGANESTVSKLEELSRKVRDQVRTVIDEQVTAALAQYAGTPLT